MKQRKQPSIVLSPERAKLLLELTDEQAGQIVKALVAYANTQALPEFSGVLLYCYNTLFDDIKQNFAQQAALSERNRQRSMKRWGIAQDAAGYHGMPRDTTGCRGIPRDTTGYHGIPRDTTGYHGIPRDTTGYHGIPQDTTGYHGIPQSQLPPADQPKERKTDEPQAPAGANPLDFLMTGEDGEPIVVYKHG